MGQALGSGAQRLLETSETRVAEETARGRERIAELKAQPRRADDAAPEAQVPLQQSSPDVGESADYYMFASSLHYRMIGRTVQHLSLLTLAVFHETPQHGKRSHLYECL